MSEDINFDFVKKIREEGLNSTFFEHLLSTIINSFPDHIYFKDTRSRFITINQSLSDLFNLKNREDAIGKTDFDFFTDEHAQFAYDDEQKIMKSGKGRTNYVEKETWDDGSCTWVASTKVPFYDEKGKIIGIFGISRDITKRKTVEDELNNRARELQCFIDISRIAKRKDLNSDGYIKRINDLIPKYFSHVHVVSSSVIIGNKAIRSAKFETSEFSKTYKIKENNIKIGVLEIYFKEDIRKSPFKMGKETDQVFELIVDKLGEVLEKKWIEKDLRKWEHILKEAESQKELYP
jgi:PAS domain S-box-containing protein